MRIMSRLLLKYSRIIKRANKPLLGIISAPSLLEKGGCKMRSEILENTLKKIDNVLSKELNLGLKLVYFDENDEEIEIEYRKLSSFSVIKEE